MSLIGNTIEEKIWNYLITRIKNPYGVAGLMGNMQAESGLKPTNLQQTYERKLGFTDASYTAAVDNGTYTNFIHDSAGYGLVQWTFWSLKKYLYDFAKSKGTSIGDLEMQLNCICTQLSVQYRAVWQDLCNATSVLNASNSVLLKFERPADQSQKVQALRASYGQAFYDKFANKTNDNDTKGENIMSNSSLVNYVKLSPNHSGRRTHSVDRITPHCVVGQLSAAGIASCFPAGRSASCNYGIGKNGDVALIVDEANRSWCSSSNANDQRAITIECASDTYAPYAMTSAVYAKLIDLCTDICRRYGKNKLIWFGDKNKTLNYNPASNEMVITVHRWFANKSCPGDWLYSRLGDLANQVTKRLGGQATSGQTNGTVAAPVSNSNESAIYQITADVLNIRQQPTTASKITGQIKDKGRYTITQIINGWGKLKSGAGWISMNYAKKVSGSVPTYTNSTISGRTNSASTYKITANVLNVRKGPGTNYPVTTQVKKGQVYTITDVQGGWGKLKSGAGWICLTYAQQVSYGSNKANIDPKPAAAPKATSNQYRVTADVLNVRKGPGTNYGIATQVRKNQVYTIVQANGNWGKLKSGAGWINLRYAKRL